MNQSDITNGSNNSDKLAADLKSVIVDAEDLLRATASQAGDSVASARARIQESLDNAKARLSGLSDAGLEQAKEAAYAVDDFVHEHPWQAIGAGLAVGLVLGALMARRD